MIAPSPSRTLSRLVLAGGGAVLLLLASCVVTLVAFSAPAAVLPGQLFEVTVTASHTKGTGGSKAAAVLQLPPGFTVIRAWSDGGGVTRDDPAVLALYKARPGFTLASFSGAGSGSTGPPNPVTLRLLLQAPPTPGSWPLALALAGEEAAGWQTQDPKGVGDFSRITGPPHLRPITVTATGTLPDLQGGYRGLPWLDGSNWSGVTLGDIDRDGRDDLACVARLGNGPRAYLSRPSGWVERSGNLPGYSGRSDVAFGDFNADGRLDLACGNGGCWLGDGQGGWTPATAGIVLRSKSGTEGVGVGDVNHDGYDDVVFGGHFDDVLQCFLSDGKGGWKESSAGLTMPPASATGGGHKLLVADVTGDGHADIVWTRFYAPEIWAGDGKGGWRVLGAGFTRSQFYGVTRGDVDGDGVMELIFGSFHYASGSALGGGVQIFKRTAQGKYNQLTNTGLPQSPTANGVAAADYDGDGHLDIAVGMTAGTGKGIFVYRGDGKGGFTAWNATGLPASGLPGYVEGLATGDFNGDGWPDLAAACYGLGVCVFRNTRTGFHLYGRGCRGALTRAPALSFTGAHRQGTATATWNLGAAPAGAPYLFALGASRVRMAGQPLLPLDLGPLGAPGCAVHAAPLLLRAGASTPAGTSKQVVPIPLDPALHRRTLFGQYWIQAAAANPLGLVVTAGGALTID